MASLPDYSAGFGLDPSGNPYPMNQGLLGLGQQGGGNPFYQGLTGALPIIQNTFELGSDWNTIKNQPQGGAQTFPQQGGVPNQAGLDQINNRTMQGGGNPNYQMNTAQVQQQNPSYQAQNSGTAQAQSATQPQMNTGNPTDQFLNNLYSKYLGRAADPTGLQYYQKELGSGLTASDLINQFEKSPEAANYKAMQSVSPNYTGNTNPWGLTGANATGNQASTNPYIQAAQQTAVGNYQGAQTATAANRVNQNTPYSSLQYQQTGTDVNGNPIWAANQSLNPALQSAMNGLQNKLATSAGQGINTNTLAQTGINPGEMYSDAIMRRLQPQQQQQSAAIETQLANQGVMPGSEAYNRAKTQLAQQQNDQLTSAQVGGINVGLQANQQGFNQQLQQSNLPIAQLGAFNQATQPGYVNPYSQAAVSGPDYTGAYTTGQAAAIAAQNAANAKTANLQNGLFNLGSSAILGSNGLNNLTSLGKSAYDWLSGGNAYNTATNNFFTNPTSGGTFAGDIFQLG